MAEPSLVEIKITPEFQRKVRNLAKKYRRIQADLQPIFEQLQRGELSGDQIVGVGYEVFKLRVKNSDAQKGKSGGYRLIYWLQFTSTVVLLDIYSKSEQENTEVTEVQRIIAKFKQDQQEDEGANSNSNCDH
ncbi:type II toxin-antitoxin system RelE/ParE family toxin [Pantanalinema sp. GBBB05]|uniref:type II toxin-antitoxin system RelE/ParE family toxin n=1 Tax=Pantanalinema sp. GBBB05 TaxID=2604139 RepID=UPI001E186D3E|nr:type II toxin-antitoxin system RelE/ParE family toxin [Pantanalinema sp. GBBB05]